MELNSIIKIKYPIIQGGMVWCSGWRLASAVSSEGGLGLIGAGSMHPDVLRHHIRSCREALKDAPDGFNIFGVNIPLVYPQLDEVMDIIVDEKVPIVFSSAGSPKKWTPFLHENGIKVAHVISSSAFALKCVEAEVDIIVAEGFEAGGHNGKEETTTFCLIPAVRRTIGPDFPLLAAGGIATREQMKAAMVLGADGVQIGTRFALCE
ncbi:MAG: nitronate monooxygenase, partial [Bacteroidales bacterium]